jgi:hypothetical protein
VPSGASVNVDRSGTERAWTHCEGSSGAHLFLLTSRAPKAPAAGFAAARFPDLSRQACEPPFRLAPSVDATGVNGPSRRIVSHACCVVEYTG